MNDNFTLTTTQQFDNVCALRDYLANNVNPKFFSMTYHRSDCYHKRETYISKDDCGICGDILGWAPFVKGLEPIKSDFLTTKSQIHSLDFVRYGERVFGLYWKSAEWDKLFNYTGIVKDNTLQGFIKRFDNYILTTKGK